MSFRSLYFFIALLNTAPSLFSMELMEPSQDKEKIIPTLLELCMRVVADNNLNGSDLPISLRARYLKEKILRVGLFQPLPKSTCRGHTGVVTALCFLKECNDIRLISGSMDNSIRMWDLAGQQVGPPLLGHAHLISSLSVMLLSRIQRIVSGSYDNTVRIWDFAGNQRALCRDPGRIRHVEALPIAEDPLIISSSDTGICIWDIEGQLRAQCNGHTDWVRSFSWLKIDRDDRIVSVSDDRTVRVWDLHGNQRAQCNGHTGWVVAVRVISSPGGPWIVSASDDATIRLWDIQGNQHAQCNGHTGRIMFLDTARSSHGLLILSGGADSTARIWDLRGNQIVVYKGHSAGVRSARFMEFNRAAKVITTSDDTTVHIWDMQGCLLFKLGKNSNIVNLFFPANFFFRDGMCVEGATLVSLARNDIFLWDVLDVFNRIDFLDYNELDDLEALIEQHNKKKSFFISCIALLKRPFQELLFEKMKALLHQKQ